MKQVPDVIPYENGKLLLDAFEHVLNPRIFSKDKKVIIGLNLPDDSKNERFKKSKTGGSDRINYQTTLDSISDFDKEIIEVIKLAYNNN